MSDIPENEQKIDFRAGVSDILAIIDQDREREIITRRFGLYDRRETLEQIGDMLGITRERVRQLEKVILTKLRAVVESGKITSAGSLEKVIIRKLSELGRIARVQDLSNHLFNGTSDQRQRAHVAFIAELAPGLTVISENDNYHHSIGILEYGDDKKIRSKVDSIVSAIRKHGEPITIEQLHNQLSYEHPDYVRSLASISKLLAHLKDNWGLIKWPTVNPKNIRDKIYVILAENKKPMHFSKIADSIKDSSFKRKDVTTQAIHNELIKDARFVLIGRGIYALDTWGFNRGTVADIIADVLKSSPEPLHRDEIVKQVLKSRHVKETTVLLNLQNKSQFKRISKAVYSFEPESN